MANYPTRAQVESYIRSEAIARGINPDTAVAVAKSEGLDADPKEGWQSNIREKTGKREPSYGPFQLYTGGGLGNEFNKQTGLDVKDWSTWQAQVQFALDHAAKEGWSKFHAAKTVGVSRWTGLENASPKGVNANPVASAPQAPAQAQAASYDPTSLQMGFMADLVAQNTQPAKPFDGAVKADPVPQFAPADRPFPSQPYEDPDPEQKGIDTVLTADGKMRVIPAPKAGMQAQWEAARINGMLFMAGMLASLEDARAAQSTFDGVREREAAEAGNTNKSVASPNRADVSALPDDLGKLSDKYASFNALGPNSRSDKAFSFSPSLTQRLDAFLADPRVDGTKINSGHRTIEQQRALYASALDEYGSPKEAGKWVAPPGRSRHNFGRAVDLGRPSSVTEKYFHDVAKEYGLAFPMSHEPWHAEVAKGLEFAPLNPAVPTPAPRGQSETNRLGFASPTSYAKDADRYPDNMKPINDTYQQYGQTRDYARSTPMGVDAELDAARMGGVSTTYSKPSSSIDHASIGRALQGPLGGVNYSNGQIGDNKLMGAYGKDPSFAAAKPNAGMSLANQYASYGMGKTDPLGVTANYALNQALDEAVSSTTSRPVPPSLSSVPQAKPQTQMSEAEKAKQRAEAFLTQNNLTGVPGKVVAQSLGQKIGGLLGNANVAQALGGLGGLVSGIGAPIGSNYQGEWTPAAGGNKVAESIGVGIGGENLRGVTNQYGATSMLGDGGSRTYGGPGGSSGK